MRGTPLWKARGWRRASGHATVVEAAEVTVVPLRERIHSLAVDPTPDEATASTLVSVPAQGDRSVA